MVEAIRTLLCGVDEVELDVPVRAEVDGVAYAIFKIDDQIFVTQDLCTHGPGSLSEGYVEGDEIECPFHQGRFSIRTGEPTAPPCTIPLQIFRPEIIDGEVWINTRATST